MPRFGLGFALVGLLSVAAAGQDNDAVAIKISYPKAGDRVKITVEEKTVAKSVFTAAGMTQGKEEVKTKSLVYVDEIIENPKNAKRATKLKRSFEKAVLNIDGIKVTLPIEGKTVLIEKKGEAYSFAVDGKAVVGDSLKLLADEFSKPEERDLRDVMLPKEKVKPGDTWKIETDGLLKALGPDGPALAKDKVAAAGKLVKAYMKDGKQFGVLEIAIEGPVTGLGEKNMFKVTDGKLTLKYSGDGCIDGTSATGKSTAKMSLGITGSTMNIEIKASVESTESRTMEMLPKK